MASITDRVRQFLAVDFQWDRTISFPKAFMEGKRKKEGKKGRRGEKEGGKNDT